MGSDGGDTGLEICSRKGIREVEDAVRWQYTSELPPPPPKKKKGQKVIQVK